MPLDLTPDQIARLQSLGISVSSNPVPSPSPAPAAIQPTPPPASYTPVTQTTPVSPSPTPIVDQNVSNSISSTSKDIPKLGQIENKTPVSSQPVEVLTPSDSPTPKKDLSILPLLSIAGITLVSLGGLILLKVKNNSSSSAILSSSAAADYNLQDSSFTPTSTPVSASIQEYLLASQQYFSQAVQQQNNSGVQAGTPAPNTTQIVTLVNQSITTATTAINAFPRDYRGYQQRGRIYLSLISSQPQLLDQAIADLSTAFSLNTQSTDLARDLATLYAKKGDLNQTISFLVRAVAIDPTKVQNIYDLARLEQQSGLIPQAISAYTQLIPLLTDPAQKSLAESEKAALEKLVAQSGSLPTPTLSTANQPTSTPALQLTGPLIQADASVASGAGFIIAAPETSQDIEVRDQTNSNALSGTDTIPTGQSSITLQNVNVTSKSAVYVTITKGGKNQTLKILSKSNGSFTVGFDTPTPGIVEFKWWIINQ